MITILNFCEREIVLLKQLHAFTRNDALLERADRMSAYRARLLNDAGDTVQYHMKDHEWFYRV